MMILSALLSVVGYLVGSVPTAVWSAGGSMAMICGGTGAVWAEVLTILLQGQQVDNVDTKVALPMSKMRAVADGKMR